MAMNLSRKLCRSGNTLLFLLTVALVCASVSNSAQDVSVGAEFYEKQKEGWFWYQDPAPKPEEENVELEKPPAGAISPTTARK